MKKEYLGSKLPWDREIVSPSIAAHSPLLRKMFPYGAEFLKICLQSLKKNVWCFCNKKIFSLDANQWSVYHSCGPISISWVQREGMWKWKLLLCAMPWVIKSFLSDLGVSCLLPVSTELWRAILVSLQVGWNLRFSSSWQIAFKTLKKAYTIISNYLSKIIIGIHKSL